MTKAHDQVSVASGRRLRQATRDAKLQQRAVTVTGRAMFRNMPPVVRLRILGRLKKLAADAENIVATMGLRADWPNLGVISLAHSYGFSNHDLVLRTCLCDLPRQR